MFKMFRKGRSSTLFCFGCRDVEQIWKYVINVLKQNFRRHERVWRQQSLILGSPELPPIANLVLLLTKQHIVTCKLNAEHAAEPRLSGLKKSIQRVKEAELMIARKNEKINSFKVKWDKLINENGELSF